MYDRTGAEKPRTVIQQLQQRDLPFMSFDQVWLAFLTFSVIQQQLK